ncbi:MAG: DnaD domain protein [Clostridia bacterium]|nr:DnaD domain protein [Clostridia bacterium]
MATNGIPSIVENRIVENSIEENSSSNSSSVKELLYNSKVEKLQKIFIETIGSTNINNIKECINYLDKLPFELIEYALRKTARVERPSWKYAIPILESYIAKKFTTITEVQADDLKYKSKTTNPKETEEEKTARRLRELEGGTEK